MRYFINAIENESGFNHEEEVGKEDVDKIIAELETQGYTFVSIEESVSIEERWSNLEEMNETLEKEGLYD